MGEATNSLRKNHGETWMIDAAGGESLTPNHGCPTDNQGVLFPALSWFSESMRFNHLPIDSGRNGAMQRGFENGWRQT